MSTEESAEIRVVRGRGVVVEGDDIDTDRIVPARFLRCVTFDGLGETLFRDERFTLDDVSRNHPIDSPERAGASVMLSGRNFGCGSSREHAPQAIVRAGFEAVIAESFAEIFAGNSLALGLVCATVDGPTAATLRGVVQADASVVLEIDLEALTISWSDADGAHQVPCTMPADARTALMEGRWDPLFELLAARADVDATAAALPYLQWSRT